MKRTTFSALPINAVFHCGGNRCIKKSTRTALLTEYGRVFYFSQHEPVRLT